MSRPGPATRSRSWLPTRPHSARFVTSRADWDVDSIAPDNLAYVRDVSASYERLGRLRESTGDVSDAAQWFTRALDVRRLLHSRDPARTDLAEELGISLKLCAQVLADDSELRKEAYQVLAPHGQRNQLSAEGADVLTWAQEAPAN